MLGVLVYVDPLEDQQVFIDTGNYLGKPIPRDSMVGEMSQPTYYVYPLNNIQDIQIDPTIRTEMDQIINTGGQVIHRGDNVWIAAYEPQKKLLIYQVFPSKYVEIIHKMGITDRNLIEMTITKVNDFDIVDRTNERVEWESNNFTLELSDESSLKAEVANTLKLDVSDMMMTRLLDGASIMVEVDKGNSRSLVVIKVGESQGKRLLITDAFNIQVSWSELEREELVRLDQFLQIEARNNPAGFLWIMGDDVTYFPPE